ncbi:hypothetical protein [Streptosporangium jomthongense]|uniref:Uncharacterized protein n=1 Tax=Streptosporangium jomthongense TaxID=1193683 RepID=A0ABV8FAH8_9ACTN
MSHPDEPQLTPDEEDAYRWGEQADYDGHLDTTDDERDEQDGDDE